jgi:hypothetical protein
MICVCSIISVLSAPYYSEVNLHSFVKLFKFRGTRIFSMDGAYRGAAKCGYKCENIIDFVNDNLEL